MKIISGISVLGRFLTYMQILIFRVAIFMLIWITLN